MHTPRTVLAPFLTRFHGRADGLASDSHNERALTPALYDIWAVLRPNDRFMAPDLSR